MISECYDNSQCVNYYKCDDKKLVEDNLDKTREVKVAGLTLKPGCLTDLGGFFSEPVVFCGVEVSDKNHVCMIFYLGDESNIFESWYFYEKIYLITENKIFISTGIRQGRDFNRQNNRWK